MQCLRWVWAGNEIPNNKMSILELALLIRLVHVSCMTMEGEGNHLCGGSWCIVGMGACTQKKTLNRTKEFPLIR